MYCFCYFQARASDLNESTSSSALSRSSSGKKAGLALKTLDIGVYRLTTIHFSCVYVYSVFSSVQVTVVYWVLAWIQCATFCVGLDV